MTTNISASQSMVVGLRAYKFIRSFAVKNMHDVIVELITNCDDAYRKKTSADINNKIFINYYKTPEGSEYLEVVDNAIGIDPCNMEKFLLTAGNYTNVDNARGFFSTGAKNICVIGNTTFMSIKDGKLSMVAIDTDGLCTKHTLDSNNNIVGIDVNEYQRNILGIPENGVTVLMEITNKKLGSNDKISDFLRSITLLVQLRDIFANPKNIIMVDIINGYPCLDVFSKDYVISRYPHNSLGEKYHQQLTYIYPDAMTILDMKFVVPNYPEYIGRFVVNKTDKPISQPYQENMMEFGFLIKDDTSIYEVSTLGEHGKYRWNPHINYLYGYVSCNGLRDLLLKYDTPDNDAKKNPNPIIDPNRINGINNEHPMIISLYSMCRTRLELIMRNIENSLNCKSININDLDSIIAELEQLGLKIFDENDVVMTFKNSREENLIKVIKEQRTRNVISEVNNLNESVQYVDLKNENKEISDKISQLAPSKPKELIFGYNKNNELVMLPKPATTTANNGIMPVIDTIENSKQVLNEPFVYKLSDSGNIQKLYVFNKDTINVTNPEDKYIKLHRKSLNIKFINDINLKRRYVIDTTTGLKIMINLSNPIVKENLAYNDLQNIKENEIFQTHSSMKGLYFMRELICDIFTEIITENDVINNKITLTTDGCLTAQKILDHRKDVMTLIEKNVHKLFNIYLKNKQQEIKSILCNNLVNVQELLGNNPQFEELYQSSQEKIWQRVVSLIE